MDNVSEIKSKRPAPRPDEANIEAIVHDLRADARARRHKADQYAAAYRNEKDPKHVQFVDLVVHSWRDRALLDERQAAEFQALAEDGADALADEVNRLLAENEGLREGVARSESNWECEHRRADEMSAENVRLRARLEKLEAREQARTLASPKSNETEDRTPSEGE